MRVHFTIALLTLTGAGCSSTPEPTTYQGKVQRVVLDHSRELLYCYRSASDLEEFSARESQVMIRLTIGDNGKLSALNVVDSGLKSAEGRACLEKSLWGFDYPPPPKDESGTVEMIYRITHSR